MRACFLNQDIIKTSLGALLTELEAAQSALNCLHGNVESSGASTADDLGDIQIDLGRLKAIVKAMDLQVDSVATRLQFSECAVERILRMLGSRRRHEWLNSRVTACVMLAIVCITSFATSKYSYV